MKKRFKLIALILSIMIIIVGLISFSLGTLSITPSEIIQTLLGNGTKSQELALYSLRLPRITIALLVGAALATSGTILQSVTGNDLAEPGILGISSGSAMFVVVYIFLTGNNYYAIQNQTVYIMPIVALIGGCVAAILIYLLAYKNGVNPTRLVLMGIAVNAAFSALIIVLQLSFDVRDFNRVLMWTQGSLWGTSWVYVYAIAPVILILCGITIYHSRYLDVYNLGDEIAYGLGVDVERQRRRFIFLSVGLAAFSTAVAGSISFLGLIAPHIARKLVGPRHKYLTPVAILVGMFLMVIADTISRNLFAPIELYIGIVLSIIGVPYFIYLVLKQ